MTYNDIISRLCLVWGDMGSYLIFTQKKIISIDNCGGKTSATNRTAKRKKTLNPIWVFLFDSAFDTHGNVDDKLV